VKAVFPKIGLATVEGLNVVKRQFRSPPCNTSARSAVRRRASSSRPDRTASSAFVDAVPSPLSNR
jgi:hypothetical protein